MSSSSESEDESNILKKKATNSYLTLLNSNNQFSEMLKSKIKQTDDSPNLSKSFEPIASSTQIGTPVEVKRKKHVNHRDKDYRDVIVKKEQISEDSGSERKVSKKGKLKISKKKVSHAKSESSDEATPSKATKSTEHVSESSVDSESDSVDSSDTQKTAERSKIVKKPAVMSRESFSKQSNFKINFAKYNTDESTISKHKQISTKSKSETDNLPSPSRIKREASSDVGSPDRRTTTVSKKEKRKLSRKASTSESSDNDRGHVTVAPSNTSKQKSSDHSDLPSDKGEKRQKKKKKRKPTNDPKASTSGSEDEISKSQLQPPQTSVTSRNNDESSTSSEDERQKDRSSNQTPSSRLRKLELDDSLTVIPNHFDSFNNIKAKEDVFIIQIPIKLDPNRLIGTGISLTDHVRVNKKYDSIVSYEPQEPITICNNTESLNIKIIRPVGLIKLQRRLHSTKIPDVPDVLNKSVEFPTNLKSRHPLFGSNFDNKITLEERVKMKLESVRDSPVKKKKKKKEKRHGTEETEHQEEEIFKFLSRGNEESERAEKKKKKKRENMESEERHEASSSKKRRSEEVEEEVPKKKKKHKESIEDTLIQEILSSMKKKKKKES